KNGKTAEKRGRSFRKNNEGKTKNKPKNRSTAEAQRGEAAIKEGPNREIRQRRENAEIRAAVFRIFGVFRGSVLREILAACEQLWLSVQRKKKLRLKKFCSNCFIFPYCTA